METRSAREARHPTRLPKGRQLVGASGEKFVGMLVSDIKQQPVVLELKTRCKAMVSSTTPRLGKVSAGGITWPMIASRIS